MPVRAASLKTGEVRVGGDEAGLQRRLQPPYWCPDRCLDLPLHSAVLCFHGPPNWNRSVGYGGGSRGAMAQWHGIGMPNSRCNSVVHRGTEVWGEWTRSQRMSWVTEDLLVVEQQGGEQRPTLVGKRSTGCHGLWRGKGGRPFEESEGPCP